MKSFLTMAPFWDPYCPPLGIASLQAYLKQRGHDVAIFDFNTDAQLWRPYRAYFDLYQQIVPESREWNIMRLGPDYFSRHQMAWFSLRDQPPRFLELSRCILNIDGRHRLSDDAVQAFVPLLETIAARVDQLTEEFMARHKPDMVGCTLLTTTMPSSLQILRKVKELNPDARTVLGGPGPIMGAGADSPDTKRVLERCPWVDNIVIGEGEVLIDALARDLLPRGKLLSLRDVPATVETLVPGPDVSQGLITNLSDLPTPDYTGLEPHRYTNLSIGVSRGCAYKCSFCYETTYWRKYRKRPIDSAVRDLHALRERYNRTRFFLCDSLANFFADDLSQALIAENSDIKWDAYLRADAELLDPAYVAQLAAGGMVRARLGLESADADTLELMNKKMSVDRMGTVLQNLAAEGIQTSTLWIVGFPEEGEQAFQESLNFLIEYKDAIYCADPWQFVFHPTTGSEPVFGRLVASESFETRYGMRRLYPEEFDDALLVQYFELDIPDVTSMKIDRIRRMSRVMEEHGIPNPYSLREWRAANRRWNELHPSCGETVQVAIPAGIHSTE